MYLKTYILYLYFYLHLDKDELSCYTSYIHGIFIRKISILHRGRTHLGHYVYVKERKRLPYEPGHWNKKKQLEVVTTYLALGNLAETARVCNVPLPTIKEWKQYSEWWPELVSEIQSGEGQKQDNKMSKVIDKALDILMTRIEEGDYQYDQKTGRLVKVPLKARDLERVTSGLFDKRQLIRKQPTNIKQDPTNQADRLLKLAEQFAEFAGQTVKKEEKVIDEYIDGEWDQVEEVKEIKDGEEV